MSRHSDTLHYSDSEPTNPIPKTAEPFSLVGFGVILFVVVVVLLCFVCLFVFYLLFFLWSSTVTQNRPELFM
jgi:hypothetical protein